MMCVTHSRVRGLCRGWWALCGGLGLLLAPPERFASAADDSPPTATSALESPAALVLEPRAFTLGDARAHLQLLLTGAFAADDLRDLTDAAEFTSSDPRVAAVEKAVVRPVANGKAVITATVAGHTASTEVTVTGLDQPAPVSFKNETLAALTKAGCNQGACHGSPSGKAGFRLSLRAFDPVLDRDTLRQEFFGRRANVMQPGESLLLKKPLMEVAHGGGKRIHKGDPAWTALHDWIGEGMRVDEPATPDLVRIELFPKKRVFRPAGTQQQLRVSGHFSDGSVRDLTALTVFSSSSESVAAVSESGLVEKEGRGETAILARYLDKMDTAELTFLEDVSGFAWNDPPANNFVDTLVFEKLKQLQILPSDLCSDEEFLRRAYLDTTGRLPTVAETTAWLADAAPDKRARLIDELLASPDFADFWTLKWSDILRSNSKKLKDAGVHKFRRWIWDAVYDDKPLDQFARELLTASGSHYENPAANYWRASRDALDATETTAQLFLGIRIQCAKCHNHPFERWSQDNYYGIAAAFTRIDRKKGPRPDEEIIFATHSGEVKQPRTGQTMKVHLLLKGDVDVPDEADRREVFANWLTAPENPFFAQCSVNRIWGHLMGRGIVDPVDDFRDSNPPSNRALLEELARQFVANGYSTKWAIRAIMTSRVYQLSSRTNEFNEDDELYHSHATTRLLSAEQLLDAISQVTEQPEKFEGLPPGTRAVELPDPPTDHYFLKIFGQPQREMACQCERSSDSNLSQALQMINGPTVHGKLRAENNRLGRLLAAGRSDDEIITELYLAAVCRLPVAEELAASKEHIARSTDRRQALEDVAWAVLNSKEFLFQH
jgi:Protein of unknown function (DUF1553)/Protein of unknown function (DUF1549)